MELDIVIPSPEILREKLSNPELLGEPLRAFFGDIITDVVPQIQDMTPVDTGQLRGSFALGAPDSMTEIDSSPVPLWANIGSTVGYAVYVEEGSEPHWTSWVNLNEWAYRHDMNVYALQAAIARRGTSAHHMVSDARDDLEAEMPNYVEELANAIEGKFEE